MDEAATMCRYVQITWQHCTSNLQPEKQKYYLPDTVWINRANIWTGLDYTEEKMVHIVLKWKEENGIIVDDKITGNGAREWERSLLSRFFTTKKNAWETKT